MADSLRVQILEAFNQHMEVSTGNLLREFAAHCDVFEEFSSLCKLEDNGKNFLLLTALFFVGGLRANVMEADDVRMLEALQDTELML